MASTGATGRECLLFDVGARQMNAVLPGNRGLKVHFSAAEHVVIFVERGEVISFIVSGSPVVCMLFDAGKL